MYNYMGGKHPGGIFQENHLGGIVLDPHRFVRFVSIFSARVAFVLKCLTRVVVVGGGQ